MKTTHRFLAFLLLMAPWLNPFAPGPSPSAVPWLFSMACMGGVLLIGAFQGRDSGFSLAKTPSDASGVFSASLLAAGLVSSVLAVIQYVDLAALFAPWVNATQPGEAFANLRQRNHFATLTNMALTALIVIANTLPQPNSTPKKSARLAVLMAAVGVLAVGNAISSSRTGLFQLALLSVLYAVWGGWRHGATRRLLICALFVYAAAMFAVPWAAGLDLATHGAFARLGKEEACGSRLMLWSNVLHLIAQKPWLGWGWGELDYAHFITLYDEPRFCDILDNAHNLPLQLAVELGVPVALLVCGIFSWWVAKQKPWAERDAARQMAWAVMAVILLHSMLEYPLWYGPFQIAFVLCLVILRCSPVAASGHENSAKNVSNPPVANINRAQAAIVIVACTACLAGLAYAAWDYRRVSQIYLQPEARAQAYQDNTLAEASKSWLFADQALFAELILTPLTPATAVRVYASAGRLLHYSPEPRVVIMLIESAVMLGKDAEALAYLARFKAAFPKEHAAWAKANSAATKD